MILLVNGAGGDCHVAVSSQNRVRYAGDDHRRFIDDRERQRLRYIAPPLS